jgi:hypothetical protein
MAEDLTVAQIILDQLGGNRFARMTGAWQFLGSEEGRFLRFKVPGAKDGIALVKITLDPNDTYTVEFLSKTGSVIWQGSDIYADMLEDIFTDKTGLATRL